VAGSSGANRVNEVFSARGIQFAFGPSFSWPILNYGQITNNVRVQDARLQALLIEYQNTVLKAQQEVENGLATFVQGRRQVDLLRRSVAAANSALRISIDQYLLGTRDFTADADRGAGSLPSRAAWRRRSGSVSKPRRLPRSGGGWQIRRDNEFVNATTREKCAAGQIGASCCRLPTNRSRRPRVFPRGRRGTRREATAVVRLS
jgi:hypothetical protein